MLAQAGYPFNQVLLLVADLFEQVLVQAEYPFSQVTLWELQFIAQEIQYQLTYDLFQLISFQGLYTGFEWRPFIRTRPLKQFIFILRSLLTAEQAL